LTAGDAMSSAGKGEQHRDPHNVRLVVGVYLAGLPADAKLLPGDPEAAITAVEPSWLLISST